MSLHPTLTLAVYIGAAVVFALVLAYMFFYTRSLKVPRGMSKSEGIAVAMKRRQRENDNRRS